MKNKHAAKSLPKLLLHLAIPLLVGGTSALLSLNGFAQYQNLPPLPLSPPQWVFPVVWTALYLLMGYGAYRVAICQGEAPRKRMAFVFYGAQLFFNFLWPLWFFQWQLRGVAFFWLVALLTLAALMTHRFRRLDQPAGFLQIPYLLWLLFACYLNLGHWVLV